MSLIRLATVALCACALSVAAAHTAAAQTIAVSKDNRTIAVTATDKVVAIADTASVHIGFTAYGPDSDTAYATGSRLSNAIIQSITTAANVPAEAIESENQSVSPVQEYQNQNLTPAEKAQRHFIITQTWTVRANAKDAARILDIAVKAGANQSGQIDWSFEDENAPQAEAAAKALQRARSQAEQMARSLNAKLGALLYATDTIEATPVRPLMRAMAAPMAMEQKVAPLAINPRRVEKSATVYAVFAIE